MEKRRVEYSGDETKKDFIIKVSQSDPFLKIEEIAKLADTTPLYVRTILSEANLSLMKLRKEYARKMEKDNESKILLSFKGYDKVINIHTDENDSIVTYDLPQCAMLESSEDFYWSREDDTLYRYFQHVYYKGKPVGIITLIIGKELDSNRLEANKSLFKKLGLDIDEIRLTCPEIEMGVLDNFLELNSFQIKIPYQNSTIKMKTFLTRDKVIFGEEIFYFRSDYVKLIIPGVFNPTLELAKDS